MKIALETNDYWKLRALCGDTQRLQVLSQAVTEQIKIAQDKQERFLAELALGYGFPEQLPTFSLDDGTQTVTYPEMTPV